MTTPCDWIESRIEDLVSDDPRLDRVIGEHTSGCASCRRQVDTYLEVGRLLGACFHQRAVEARRAATAPRLPARLVLAAAVLGAVLLAVWFGVLGGSARIAVDSASGVPTGPSAIEAGPDRAKPSDGEPEASLIPGEVAPPPPADIRFYVMDATGYVHTLDEFRGSVVVMGVLEGGAEAGLKLGRLYESIPPRADLRFLAVGLDAMPAAEVRGIPLMVNRGSTLLETAAGEFAILTREGQVHSRGTLSDPDFEDLVRAGLRDLDVPLE
jgi:hypothetical protein